MIGSASGRVASADGRAGGRTSPGYSTREGDGGPESAAPSGAGEAARTTSTTASRRNPTTDPSAAPRRQLDQARVVTSVFLRQSPNRTRIRPGRFAPRDWFHSPAQVLHAGR